MYKKRRRSSWPSQLLAMGLVLGGSLVATSVFAGCGGAAEPITITPGEEPKSCRIDSIGDDDSFQFIAVKGNIYQISAVVNKETGADIDIALEAVCGTDSKKSANSNFEGEGEDIKDLVPSADGNCNIWVFHTGFFGSNTAYQLTVTEAPKPQATKIDVDKTSILDAKASQLYQLTFKVLDDKGQVMQSAGQQIQLTLTDSGGTPVTGNFFGSDNPVAIGDGQKAVDFTAPATAGNYQITAELVGNSQVKLASPIEVTVKPGDLASLTLTLNNDCQSPHSADVPCTLKVEGKDGKDGGGNTVSTDGQQITLNLTAVDKNNQPISITDSTKVVTVTNGVTEDLQLKTAGNYTIKATSPVPSAKDVTVEVVAGAPTALEKVSSTCQGSQPANQPCDLTFKLIDANKNAVGGKTVNFTLTPSGDGTTLTTPVASDSSVDKLGEVKITLTPATTLAASQSYTISASVTEGGAPLTITPAVTVNVVVVSVPTPTLSITQDQDCPSLSVGTKCSFTFKLTGDNASTAKIVKVSWTKPDGSTENLPDVTIQDEAGSKTTLKFDLVGNYTIAAVLADNDKVKAEPPMTVTVTLPSPTPTTLKLIDEKGQEIGVEMVTNIDSRLPLTFQLLDNGQPPTGIEGKLILLELTKPTACNDSSANCNAQLELASTGEEGIPTNKDGKIFVVFKADDTLGEYTIKASLKDTNSQVQPATVTVTVVSLTVTKGGNQSVSPNPGQLLAPATSKPIVVQLKTENQNEAREKEILFSLMDSSPPSQPVKEGVSWLDERDKPLTPDNNGMVTVSSDKDGKVQVRVSLGKKPSEAVTSYLLSVKLKDNPGVADYTNVFLLEKPLAELLNSSDSRWPTLKMVNNDTVATDGDGTGLVADKDGNDLQDAAKAKFYGGLSLKDGTEAEKAYLQKNRPVTLRPVKDEHNEITGPSGENVVVQGIIEVVPEHVGEIADIVVWGKNTSQPSDGTKYDGVYMLTASGIMPLADENQNGEVVDDLIPFRRGVTLGVKEGTQQPEPEFMLMELYSGQFFYPASKLQIYFGYRLTTGTQKGTVMFNGSNPIYITIEETPPSAPADGSATEGKTDAETSPTPETDTTITTPPASESSGG